MQADSVMSLVSMIAAAVTAIAAMHGEWSWIGRARALLELADMLGKAGGKQYESAAARLRFRALDTAERGLDEHRGAERIVMAMLFSLQSAMLVVAVVYGMDVAVPAAGFMVSAMSLLVARRSYER